MLEAFYMVLPIAVAIVVLMLSKNSVVSLLFGLISAAFVIAGSDMPLFMDTVGHSFKAVFYDRGVKVWNVAIMVFLPLLMLISVMMHISGGLDGLISFLKKRIKTKKGAEFTIFLLGILIYIDGYFNAVILGNISRAFARSHKVSRAKLAYIVDSTAAPICPLSPISSWGAAILGIIGASITKAGATVSAPVLFFKMLPYQVFTYMVLIVILLTIFGNLKIGFMAEIERGLADDDFDRSNSYLEREKKETGGKISNFFYPIISLLVVTSVIVLVEGATNSKSMNLVTIIANSNLALAMVYGAIFTLVTFYLKIMKEHKLCEVFENAKKPLHETVKTILLLIIAWAMINAIDTMGLGAFLSRFVKAHDISATLLPLILFEISAILSFASGTSWGTFYLFLPVAFSLGIGFDIDHAAVFMAAVISGSVFGDNCSLISDTTIISANATNCHLDMHYVTQIPYALIAGVATAVAFLLLGLSSSLILAYGCALLSLWIFVQGSKRFYSA